MAGQKRQQSTAGDEPNVPVPNATPLLTLTPNEARTLATAYWEGDPDALDAAESIIQRLHDEAERI